MDILQYILQKQREKKSKFIQEHWKWNISEEIKHNMCVVDNTIYHTDLRHIYGYISLIDWCLRAALAIFQLYRGGYISTSR